MQAGRENTVIEISDGEEVIYVTDNEEVFEVSDGEGAKSVASIQSAELPWGDRDNVSFSCIFLLYFGLF